jgi:glycogen debranching enzyme
MPSPSPIVLDEGTPLRLSSAGDVETLVRASGTRYIVTNRNGDITPAGARELGLLSDDTRYLSHYELTLRRRGEERDGPQTSRDLVFVYLSSDAFDAAENRIDLMVSGLETAEFLDDPQNFLHVRRRQLVDDSFHEQVELVNYLQRRVDVEIVLSFAVDFADVFEMRGAKRSRRGTLRGPRVRDASVDFTYDGIDGRTYVSRVTFAPRPTSITSSSAVFRLAIEAGGSAKIDICVAPSSASASTVQSTRSFDARADVDREIADRFVEECTRFRCDNAIIQNVLEQSTRDLRALSIAVSGHRVLAAGIPWFCCPFGRDTLLAAYEALTLNPELAASSLRALAAFQGTRFDDFTEEEPGKIFHELRFGEMAGTREIPHSPYYGSIDATPLFVVVAHATYKVTGDHALLADLRPAILAALDWIDRRSDEGRKLVTYERMTSQGLENQGWKDSRAGVSFPDGRRAQPPIALSEVQGYCVDAYRRGAALLAAMGDAESAVRYEACARRMAEAVELLFWLPDLGRYAFAVDGQGVALPTVVSNVGHLLWSRLPPIDRARSTAHLLTLPASMSPLGIRTLAAGQRVYNPLSYHNGTVWPHDNAIIAKGLANYDLMDHACNVFEAIVAAMGYFSNRRLPELYCGMSQDQVLVRYPVACSPQAWAAASPFLLLQAVLGIHIDAPAQRLLIRNPKMPTSMSKVSMDGLRVGRSRVSLRLHRVGKRCHVDRLDITGAPLRTFVEIE